MGGKKNKSNDTATQFVWTVWRLIGWDFSHPLKVPQVLPEITALTHTRSGFSLRSCSGERFPPPPRDAFSCNVSFVWVSVYDVVVGDDRREKRGSNDNVCNRKQHVFQPDPSSLWLRFSSAESVEIVGNDPWENDTQISLDYGRPFWSWKLL